jgi:predicted phosphodiesterase
MRKFLQKILTNPVIRLADKYGSRPKRDLIFSALDKLYKKITAGNETKGLLIPCDPQKDKFIIFSDLHKGARNGADDFMVCEQTYLEALNYYEKNAFHYICLGDAEELWENNLFAVRAANKASIEKEKLFVQRGALTKIFGNHDLFWDTDPFSGVQLKSMYGAAVKIYAGVVLQMKLGEKPLSVFLTHGHQGDEQSDGNWFSKFFVSRIWAPLQSYLRINPNTPAYNSQLKTLHNTLMYEWSSKQDGVLLITGHTHQPVFESLTLLESLVLQLDGARRNNELELVHTLESEIRNRQVELPVALNMYDKIQPSYFNSGCCCYSDGDITGIEIEGGCIRLIRWKTTPECCNRSVLAEKKLSPSLFATDPAAVK